MLQITNRHPRTSVRGYESHKPDSIYQPYSKLLINNIRALGLQSEATIQIS